MKKILLPTFIILIVIFTACSGTKISNSWREPNKQVSLSKLNKVLVVAFFRTETARHQSEDQMVAYLNGRGVASYNYLDASFNKKDEAALREKIKKDEFDGAITMRLVDVDKERVIMEGDAYAPAPYNRNFGGYYSRYMPFYSMPDYYVNTKTYTVETNVYSIKDDKIIWASITKTTDPVGVDKMMKEIVSVVYKRMVKEGFITK